MRGAQVHAWRDHSLRRDDQFAPALRGQVTVSLLFNHNSCIVLARTVLIAVMDNPSDSERETGIKCMHRNFDFDHHHPQTGM